MTCNVNYMLPLYFLVLKFNEDPIKIFIKRQLDAKETNLVLVGKKAHYSVCFA